MPAAARPRLTRPAEGRAVAGVCAGIARHLGVDVLHVRLATVVLALAGGAGVVVYVAAWVLVPADGPGAAGPPAPARRATDPVQVAALAAIVVGVLLLAGQMGVWFPGRFAWPIVLAAAGLALAWGLPRDGDEAEPPDWPVLRRLPAAARDAVAVLVGTRRGSLARTLAGVLLIGAGSATFLASSTTFDAALDGAVAAVVVLAGLLLVAGPWLWQLVTALGEERRERIRSQERAEMAAHLHDSVLQTLAMVQRRAGDPRAVVALARRQERELRAWLLSGQQPNAARAATLGTALEDAAAEVEAAHGVPLEVVRVRDCPLEPALEPLLAAAREAMVNAARHSGAPSVSVYLEVEPAAVTVFVRDTGRGFDRDAVPADRRGIAESIEGRLARHGGTATIHAAPGEGTEVELVVPRDGRAAAPAPAPATRDAVP